MTKQITSWQKALHSIHTDMATDLTTKIVGLHNRKPLKAETDDPNLTLVAEVEIPKASLGDWANWIPREAAFPSGQCSPAIHPNDRCDVEYRLAA